MKQDSPETRLRARSLWALLGTAALALVSPRDAAATPASFEFTQPNPGFVPALLNGQPLTDPEGDTPGARDIVGDSANPMLYVASDADHIYLRLRVDSNPLQNATNFGPFGWGCFIDHDNNPQTYEYSTLIDGVNNPDVIYFYKNTTTVTPDSPQDEPDLPAVATTFAPLTAAVGHAQVVTAPSTFGGNTDYFIDWVIERSVALSVGFDPGKASRYYCGSANNGTTITADCSGGTASGCPLSSQFTDPIACGAMGCAVCGDGTVTAGEGCDDGNFVSGDGCSASCLVELGYSCTQSAACLSGYCDATANACACNENSDCPAGDLCKTSSSPHECVAPGCGNGILEAGEACDDGNLFTGDGCDAQCLLELGEPCALSPECASGFCDPADDTCACDAHVDCPIGELCNLSATPNACVAPGCGNGVKESGEGCDDGNLSPNDGCSSMCLLELGQLCALSADCASEYCDSGSGVCACNDHADCPGSELCNTTTAPPSCVAPGCGNGVKESGEGCDDGNLSPNDGCNASCRIELGYACSSDTACASGACDDAASLCVCDDHADCPEGGLCRTSVSPAACVLPGCGNGVLEAGEACDDGNTQAFDGCNETCLLEIGQLCGAGTECASGFCDPSDDTCACNDDGDCPSGLLCNTIAAPNLCVDPGCGNGVVETGEGCDDGNNDSLDGCSATCLAELGSACSEDTACETGLCNPETDVCACVVVDDCPTGQLCSGTGACVDPGCGNGVLETGEACDDGNSAVNDGCNAACLLELGQSCTNAPECASGFCQDGSVCACNGHDDCPTGQECNQGLTPHQCVPAGCGNGVLAATEACDDGNLAAGDGCNAQCLRELGEACSANTQCASDYCEAGSNVCACNDAADCALNHVCRTPAPATCVPAGCGNAVLEASEGCDDGNTASGDGCSADCLVELEQPCTSNDACSTGRCDPSTDVCVCRVDTDCAGGKLCNATASPPVCVDAICGDGKLGVGEACDDLNTASGDGCSSACAVETGWSCENEPSSCAPIAECATDDDCGTKQRCDVQAGVCAAVECRVDADCAGTATCNAETYACEQSPGDPEGVFAAGSGISCSVRPERTGRGLVYAGLLSLGLLVGYRRRRRD